MNLPEWERDFADWLDELNRIAEEHNHAGLVGVDTLPERWLPKYRGGVLPEDAWDEYAAENDLS